MNILGDARDSRRRSAPVAPRSIFVRRLRRGLPLTALAMGATVALVMFSSASGTQAALAGQAPVGLGTTQSFAVLAGTTVTNTGPSVISGNLGVSPGSAVTGFPPGIVNDGVIHKADGVAGQAQSDLVTAYNDAAGRTPVTVLKGDLAGRHLKAGIYKATSSLLLNGTVTLDAENDPNAVFIFQVASALTTGSSSTVALVRGAQPCNVFWQIGSSATLGTGSTFVGNLMALTSAALQTGATVQGRILARNGAVTLDTNTITRPGCLVGPPPTSTPPTSPTSTGPTSTGPTNTTPGHGGGGQSSTPATGPPKGHPGTGSGGSYQASSSSLIPLGGLALVGAAFATVMAVRRRRSITEELRAGGSDPTGT